MPLHSNYYFRCTRLCIFQVFQLYGTNFNGPLCGFGGKKRMAWTDGTFPLWIFHDTRGQYARITSVAYFIFVLLSCLSVAIIVGLPYPTRNRDTCMGHSTNDTTNELYYRMQWHQWCGIINLNPVIRLAVGGRTTVFAISVLLHCIVSYFMASPFLLFT